jgi:hypothetical protein
MVGALDYFGSRGHRPNLARHFEGRGFYLSNHGRVAIRLRNAM